MGASTKLDESVDVIGMFGNDYTKREIQCLFDNEIGFHPSKNMIQVISGRFGRGKISDDFPIVFKVNDCEYVYDGDYLYIKTEKGRKRKMSRF